MVMEAPPDSDMDAPGEDAVLDSAAFRAGRWILGGLAAAYALTTLLPSEAKPGWVDTW